MSPRRLLLVKMSSLGDLVHCLPMVTDLRAVFPDLAIDWVAEEAFVAIPELHPGVRRVIPVGLRRWRRPTSLGPTATEVRAFLRQLREDSYDVVLDSQGLYKSALIGSLARGPVWGADRRSAREGGAAWFYARHAPVVWQQHAAARNRALAAALFGYPVPTVLQYGVTTAARDAGATMALCLHGTSRPEKLWPVHSWALLAQGLLARGLVPVFPQGTAVERARAEQIVGQVPGAQLLPPTPLAQMAVVLARAAIAVGVDTGLVHLAVALGCPTIALYIESDPALNGVLPQAGGRAQNLGGRGQMPAVAAVLECVGRMCA